MDGGILQQGIVVIHIPVVGHDPEGEVVHIHVLTHHVLQHDPQLVGILGEADHLLLGHVARHGEGIEAMPKRVQLVGLCRIGLAQGTYLDVLRPLDSLRRLGRVVPCVTALVQPGPSDYLIGTRLHVEGDGVPLVQLALLDPPLEEEVSFLVAEEERNEVYLMLESVGEFHIIVVLEIQPELAKRQRVVVYPIASV